MQEPGPVNMLSLILDAIEVDGRFRITFITTKGVLFEMRAEDPGCTAVQIESITGDLDNLIGAPILRAEQRPPEEPQAELQPGTWVRTYFDLATAKGQVTVCWLGTAGGGLSEQVEFWSPAA